MIPQNLKPGIFPDEPFINLACVRFKLLEYWAVGQQIYGLISLESLNDKSQNGGDRKLQDTNRIWWGIWLREEVKLPEKQCAKSVEL